MVSAILATISCILSIILTTMTENVVMTAWGCCSIAWGTIAILRWREYINSRNKSPKS